MDFESGVLDSDTGPEMYGDDDFTPAHQAATTGDLQLLVKAIKQDPSVIQQRDRDGYTPLSHAVLGKHTSIVKRLVKMGADVNAQDDNCRTCLSVAAYQGWSDGVIYLLRKGARADIADKSGRTPLHAATYDTDTRSLIAILKRLNAEDEINIGDNERMTALHWAAFHNRPDHVRQLLQSGAKCSLTDIDGKTPLHWAAQNGSSSCCFGLLEECPDLLKAIDNSGKTVVHLAAAAGHFSILHELASLAPSISEAVDKDDRTPLHWAAATGKASCVRALLNLGVTRNPRDMDGVTPLEYATNAGHKECAHLLQDRPSNNPSSKGNKTEDKNSKPGFFKGLFSRKKTEQVNKEMKDEQTKLPYVVQNKHGVTTATKGDLDKLDKESTYVRDVSSRMTDHAHITKLKCSPLPDVVISYQSQENRNIYTAKDIEGLTVKEKLTDTLKKGAAMKKKKKKHKRSDEGGSTRTSSLNDNSCCSSPALHTQLIPLDSLGIGSRDSPSVRRLRDLSPIDTDKLIKGFHTSEPVDKSKLLKSRSVLDPDSNSASPAPPLPFSITGRVILPEIRTGLSGPLPDLDKRKDTPVKHKKKFHDVISDKKHEQESSQHGVGIYTPQDRGRDV